MVPASRWPAGVPLRAAAVYAGSARQLVLAWKERHDLGVQPLLAQALAVAVTSAAMAAGLEPNGTTQRMLLIPVPSRHRVRVARGADVMTALAVAAATAVGRAGWECDVVPGVLRRVGATDQVGLGTRARRDNAAVAYRFGWRRPGPGTVILVDDIVTTGATLGACRSLLQQHGVDVAAAAAVCATKAVRIASSGPSLGTQTLSAPSQSVSPRMEAP